MAKTKQKRKKKKLVWRIIGCVFLIALIAGVIMIRVINGNFEVDRDGSQYILEPGEATQVTLRYNGADGMPESEVITCKAFEPVALPELTKEGYHFLGWFSGGTFIGNELTVNANYDKSASAMFQKDYSAIAGSAALFTDNDHYTEYDEGEYASVNVDTSYIFVGGGYKVIAYDEENFAGNESVIAYSSKKRIHVGSMKIVPIESQGIEIDELTDERKAELLYTYAPRIWWSEGEKYFASTMENLQANTERIMTDRGYIYSVTELDSPLYRNDYLHGSTTDCKTYAFIAEKDGGYLDLSYFVFTPYNKSKVILGMELGNHIGDWEHVAVRLMKYEENGKTFYRPTVVDYSAHSFRNFVAWDDAELAEGTHFVAYTALGSHGFWSTPGVHAYVDIKVARLTDECTAGSTWDLWHEGSLETYSYDCLAHTGYGIGGSEWNTCFDLDFYDPDSMAVSMWGNKGWYLPIQIYPALVSGPTGPQSKPILYNYYILED